MAPEVATTSLLLIHFVISRHMKDTGKRWRRVWAC